MCTALVNTFDSLHSVCVLQVGACARVSVYGYVELTLLLQCCVCAVSLVGLKYCHDHMARVGSAAAEDDADSKDSDCDNSVSLDAAASGFEMGGTEGDKRQLISDY